MAPRCASDVPEELRLGADPRDETMFGWHILKSEANPWVAPLIEKLPRPYPKAFTYFISSYRFYSFVVGPVKFSPIPATTAPMS